MSTTTEDKYLHGHQIKSRGDRRIQIKSSASIQSLGITRFITKDFSLLSLLQIEELMEIPPSVGGLITAKSRGP